MKLCNVDKVECTLWIIAAILFVLYLVFEDEIIRGVIDIW